MVLITRSLYMTNNCRMSGRSFAKTISISVYIYGKRCVISALSFVVAHCNVIWLVARGGEVCCSLGISANVFCGHQLCYSHSYIITLLDLIFKRNFLCIRRRNKFVALSRYWNTISLYDFLYFSLSCIIL